MKSSRKSRLYVVGYDDENGLISSQSPSNNFVRPATLEEAGIAKARWYKDKSTSDVAIYKLVRVK